MTLSAAGGRLTLAGILLLGFLGQPLVGPFDASAQTRQILSETRHTLSDEELRAGILPALTSMALFVLTAEHKMLQRELPGNERYWRPMLPVLEGRNGPVAVEVRHSWPTMPRSWVDDIDEVLPGLTEAVVASLQAEEHPVRAVTMTCEIDPAIRGVNRGSEWRTPDGALLAACELVRPAPPRRSRGFDALTRRCIRGSARSEELNRIRSDFASTDQGSPS